MELIKDKSTTTRAGERNRQNLSLKYFLALVWSCDYFTRFILKIKFLQYVLQGINIARN
jgi:hypothetical protein